MKHWFFGAVGFALGVAIGLGGATAAARLRPSDQKPVEIAKLPRTDVAEIDDSGSMPEHRGEIDAGDLQPDRGDVLARLSFDASVVDSDILPVSYDALGNEVQIIGRFGKPLLHLLQIEGARFVYPDDVPAPKAADWEIYFDVTRLNGEALEEPMRILLNRWSLENRAGISPGEPMVLESLKYRAEIPAGEPMVLEGYEDGGYSGVFDVKNDPHHKYRNMRAGSPRHFSVEFFVLDAKSLEKATAKTDP